MPGLLDALKDPEFRRQVLQGLTDAGNRGLAAGLGGPVDLAELVINAGLGLAGQKPISNSVGGSEWIGQQMQRIGSVSDVRNPTAEFLASLLMPGASVKGAKVIGKAVDNAQKPGTVARAGERGAIVYHGTPHKFDKFDSSKIGTGEGAQAYGHGLYLAENPTVAKEYQKLSPTVEPPPVRTFMGEELTPGSPQYHAARLADEMSLPQARKLVSGWLQNADPRMVREAEGWKQTLDVLNQAQKKSDFKKLKNTGNLYSVDLPDDQIAKMLDWDKPLSQQPENVRAAIDQVKANLTGPFSSNMTGDQLLRHIQSTLKSVGRGDEKAETVLRSYGVPGVRYLDGGSRGTGTGTSNFVVFPGNEDMLKILERNGKPLK